MIRCKRIIKRLIKKTSHFFKLKNKIIKKKSFFLKVKTSNLTFLIKKIKKKTFFLTHSTCSTRYYLHCFFPYNSYILFHIFKSFILMEDSKCSKCNCQRYKVQAGKEVCFFCSHSIGFHKIPFSNINTEEHPYGLCLECRCQFYKEEIPYKCVYCGHSQDFHRSWANY